MSVLLSSFLSTGSLLAGVKPDNSYNCLCFKVQDYLSLKDFPSTSSSFDTHALLHHGSNREHMVIAIYLCIVNFPINCFWLIASHLLGHLQGASMMPRCEQRWWWCWPAVGASRRGGGAGGP